MKISRNWLQTYFDKPLPTDEEISEALTFHVFEIDGIEKHQNDSVFDVKVTPNRGHDCLSYRGIAKELSIILRIPLKQDPLAIRPQFEQVADAISVSIDSSANGPLCRRYIAGHIIGVTVGPSPDWLVERLATMGQRSINNVVDATNFVMFNIGQPLHAFDAACLGEKDGVYQILVRTAREGERLLALDDNEHMLTSSNLIIVDDTIHSPVGIAGIKGGKPAGINEYTTNIIIESANFSGPSVRKTAQELKLRTDASSRFEQEISPELAAYGMRAVVELILELAGGSCKGYVDVYPTPVTLSAVSVSRTQINEALGTQLTSENITDIFSRLGFAHLESGDTFTVTPSFERLDIIIPEDLIEEVGRITGYDAIVGVELPYIATSPAINHSFYTIEHIRSFLVERGFSEVYTSVFAETGEQVILNKVDGVRQYLRDSLTEGVVEALGRNVRIKDVLGLNQVKIFEIGTVWRGGIETMALALAVEQVKKNTDVMTYMRELCDGAGVVWEAVDTSGTALEIPLELFEQALILTEQYDDLPLSTTERYTSFSKYPAIIRDVALWCPAGTSADDVQKEITTHAGTLLVRTTLFDQFEKDGRISYAFRLVFQSMDRTLLDEDAHTHMESITLSLMVRGWEVR